jgi:hypothetical protein
MRFDPNTNNNVKTMYDEWYRITDGRWTKLLSEFLKSMGASLGYRASFERPSFGGGRFDMKWQNGREVILIEYENDSAGIERSEIPKLMSATGNLRLITYVPPARFPGEDIANKVLKTLNSEKSGEDFEFLLIIGTWAMVRPTDWVGWQFYPTFKMKPLILPYLKATAGVRAAFARKAHTGKS